MSSDASRRHESPRVTLDSVPANWCELLRHPRRVRLLAALRDGESPVSTTDLTTAIRRREGALGDDRDGIRLALVHNHLPRLEEHGVVDRDGDDVTLLSEPPVDLDSLTGVLDRRGEAGGRWLHALFADPIRLRIAAVLGDVDRSLSIDRLAARLREGADGTETTAVALHHVHLPALADAGLLEYDHEDGVVTPLERELPRVA